MNRAIAAGILSALLGVSCWAGEVSTETANKIGGYMGGLYTWKTTPEAALVYCDRKHPEQSSTVHAAYAQWRERNAVTLQEIDTRYEQFVRFLVKANQTDLQSGRVRPGSTPLTDAPSIKGALHRKSMEIANQELFAGRTDEQLATLCTNYATIFGMTSDATMQKQIDEWLGTLDTLFASLPQEWK